MGSRPCGSEARWVKQGGWTRAQGGTVSCLLLFSLKDNGPNPPLSTWGTGFACASEEEVSGTRSGPSLRDGGDADRAHEPTPGAQPLSPFPSPGKHSPGEMAWRQHDLGAWGEVPPTWRGFEICFESDPTTYQLGDDWPVPSPVQ